MWTIVSLPKPLIATINNPSAGCSTVIAFHCCQPRHGFSAEATSHYEFASIGRAAGDDRPMQTACPNRP